LLAHRRVRGCSDGLFQGFDQTWRIS
jgi:hypothetical protein